MQSPHGPSGWIDDQHPDQSAEKYVPHIPSVERRGDLGFGPLVARQFEDEIVLRAFKVTATPLEDGDEGGFVVHNLLPVAIGDCDSSSFRAGIDTDLWGPAIDDGRTTAQAQQQQPNTCPFDVIDAFHFSF